MWSLISLLQTDPPPLGEINNVAQWAIGLLILGNLAFIGFIIREWWKSQSRLWAEVEKNAQQLAYFQSQITDISTAHKHELDEERAECRQEMAQIRQRFEQVIATRDEQMSSVAVRLKISIDQLPAAIRAEIREEIDEMTTQLIKVSNILQEEK